MEIVPSGDELIGMWIKRTLSEWHGIPEEDLSDPKMTAIEGYEGFNYSSYTYEDGQPAKLQISAHHNVSNGVITKDWEMEDLPKVLKELAAMRSEMVVWK